MDPVDVVLRFAKSQLYVREIGPNAGQPIEEYQRVCGARKGDPWCACAVSWCGKSALEEDWPLIVTAGCQALYEDAKKKGFLVDTPRRGDVFVMWHASLGRYAHTGFVEAAVGKSVVTLEGNTNPNGGREGYGWFRRKRVVDESLRFIRWAKM